jgi:hypothetical protein
VSRTEKWTTILPGGRRIDAVVDQDELADRFSTEIGHPRKIMQYINDFGFERCYWSLELIEGRDCRRTAD